MEKAIKDNTKITLRDHRFSDESLKILVWGALDWAGIIDTLSISDKAIMNVSFYLVRYTDWIKLYPGMVEDKTFKFNEEKQDGYATLLVQDISDDKNFDIKSFIKQGCFMYASTDKVKIMNWIGGGGR